MAELETKENEASVLAFLGAMTDKQRREDCMTVLEIMREATQAEPKMWGSSIVGFGRCSYETKAGQAGEWPATGFSPRKQNLMLYIMPGFARYDALMRRLGKHKTGKSCLYIKRLADIDKGVLKQLVAESVAAMSTKRVDR